MRTVSRLRERMCVCVCKRIDIWTVFQNLCAGKLLLVRTDDDLVIIARLQEPVGTRLGWSAASRQGGMDREMTDLTEQNRKMVIASTQI